MEGGHLGGNWRTCVAIPAWCVVLLAFAALLAWLGLRDASVPPTKMEQDVTNEVLAR